MLTNFLYSVFGGWELFLLLFALRLNIVATSVLHVAIVFLSPHLLPLWLVRNLSAYVRYAFASFSRKENNHAVELRRNGVLKLHARQILASKCFIKAEKALKDGLGQLSIIDINEKHGGEMLVPLGRSYSDPFLQLCVCPSLIDLARAYFRTEVRLVHVILRTTTAQSSFPNQQWHFDEEDLHVLKVMINLSDVQDKNGPLHVINGTTRSSWCGMRLAIEQGTRRYLKDCPLIQRLSRENGKINSCGPPGTVTVFDSSNLHKGGGVQEGMRTVLMACFVTENSMFGWRQSRWYGGDIPRCALKSMKTVTCTYPCWINRMLDFSKSRARGTEPVRLNTIKRGMLTLPCMGFGTAGLGYFSSRIVSSAVAAGHRLFDTAALYRNEKMVGRTLNVIENGWHPAPDLLVITKVSCFDLGYEATRASVLKSRQLLNIKVIPIVLLHWPVCPGRDPSDLTRLRKESWRALEDLCNEGMVKWIGVSNFTIALLDELFEFAKIMPVINQIQYNPLHYEEDMRAYCHRNNMFLLGYTPLGGQQCMTNGVVKSLAAKLQCSGAAIVLSWAISKGIIPIPKSADENHIFDNVGSQDMNLDANAIAAIDAMQQHNNATSHAIKYMMGDMNFSC